MRAAFLVVVACFVVPFPAIGQTSLPDSVPRLFDAYSNNAEWLTGSLTLSTSVASFAKYRGIMQLQFDAISTVSVVDELTGARMYRVTNAKAYFVLNKGKNGFCDSPPLWLAVQQDHEAIELTLLTIADWRKYDPHGLGICSIGRYTLRE